MAITTAEKKCVACGIVKPLEDFHRSSVGRLGRHARCKPCKNEYAQGRYRRWTPEQRELQRVRMIRYRFGVGAALIDALFEAQEGRCAICGTEGGHPIRGERTLGADTLCIDHDHETGEVRGLLCILCNSALGKLGDSVDRLVRAAAYLLERGGQ